MVTPTASEVETRLPASSLLLWASPAQAKARGQACGRRSASCGGWLGCRQACGRRSASCGGAGGALLQIFWMGWVNSGN